MHARPISSVGQSAGLMSLMPRVRAPHGAAMHMLFAVFLCTLGHPGARTLRLRELRDRAGRLCGKTRQMLCYICSSSTAWHSAPQSPPRQVFRIRRACLLSPPRTSSLLSNSVRTLSLSRAQEILRALDRCLWRDFKMWIGWLTSLIAASCLEPTSATPCNAWIRRRRSTASPIQRLWKIVCGSCPGMQLTNATPWKAPIATVESYHKVPRSRRTRRLDRGMFISICLCS